MERFGAYCAYTKAVQHLADGWSLLIIRELAVNRTLGFNALVARLPGISRSVLTRRLRKLEDFDLIARDPARRTGQAPYRLAPAGQQLVPTLLSLKTWAEHWVPQDPAAARHDPDVMVAWLLHRIDPHALPNGKAVVALEIRGERLKHAWLVVECGLEPSICIEDPGLEPDRYVYVDVEADALYPLVRAERGWASAIDDGSVRVYGEPQLVRAFPSWFYPAAHRDLPPPPPTSS